tara:strand:+ start:2796 stop:4022 length:1227 start_codon:yes stop_codon:yes gene_type:complete
MDSFIRNVCCLVFALSLSHSAFGAKTIPYQTRPPQPEYLSSFVASGVIQYPVTYETRAVTPSSSTLPSQNVTRYTTRATPLTVARAAGMARNVVAVAGGPVGFTVSAALLAGSFLIDDESGDIIKQTPADSQTVDSQNICRYWNSTNEITNVSAIACAEHVSPQTIGGVQYSFQGNFSKSCDSTTCTINVIGGGYQYPGAPLVQANLGRYIYPKPRDITTPFPTSGPASDADIVEGLSPNAINDIVNDSVQSGRWKDEWPEAGTEADKINRSLENDIEGATNPDTDITVPDSATSAPPQPQPTTGTTATEWPGFCSWAGVVCDFIDWFKDEPTPPESPDLPVTEVNPVEWESGLGVGSCPANPVVEMMGTSLEYDLTNACWGASNLFQPILIFLSLIAAAYIIIGARN